MDLAGFNQRILTLNKSYLQYVVTPKEKKITNSAIETTFGHYLNNSALEIGGLILDKFQQDCSPL